MSKEHPYYTPWRDIFWAAACFAGGIGSFNWFDRIEREGGTVTSHKLVILIYDLCGKWGVLVLFMAFAAFMAFSGIKDLISGPPSKPNKEVESTEASNEKQV